MGRADQPLQAFWNLYLRNITVWSSGSSIDTTPGFGLNTKHWTWSEAGRLIFSAVPRRIHGSVLAMFCFREFRRFEC